MDLKELARNILAQNPKINKGTQAEKAKYLHQHSPDRFKSPETARWHVRQIESTEERTPAKILLFDIETAPIVGAYWSIWDNPSEGMILRDWFMISWSAKWIFKEDVFGMVLTTKEAANANDKRITKGLWQVFDEADIVIAHNLKRFDKRVAQTRFLKYDLKLPSYYQEVDTLKSARKEFKITSNRLDYIATNFLGIDGKMMTPKGLWLDCIGNPYKGTKPSAEALKNMALYNDQDVRILEDVYLFLRGYITNHPNLALWDGSDIPICKSCGHTEFDTIGNYTTIVNTYHGYRCKNCGNVHRSRMPIDNSKICLR